MFLQKEIKQKKATNLSKTMYSYLIDYIKEEKKFYLHFLKRYFLRYRNNKKTIDFSKICNVSDF